MSVHQFLDAVLPSQGLRFVLCQFGQQGDKDFRPGQKSFQRDDRVGFDGYAGWGSREGANVFFGVAGYEFVTNDQGFARRIATAARWHRCLRIDLDVGAGPGKYPTKRDALVALLQFVQDYSLPAPWIVDSGGGAHVYWAFDRDVELHEWRGYAERLHAAVTAAGLNADSTATRDAARILRLPGTHNAKPHFKANGSMGPIVTILQQGVAAAPEAIVAAFPNVTVAAMPTFSVPASLRGMDDALSANLHEPYFMRGVLLQCPGMGAMLQDGGARAQEPLWKRALDLINKSDDPEEVKLAVARGVSQGHPGFTEEGFQRKWALVQSQNYHPPRCEQMASAGLAECATCPMRGRISSPLVTGRVVPLPPSESAVPPLPAPPAENPPATTALPPVSGAALATAPSITRIGVFELDGSSVIKINDGILTPRLSIANGFPVIKRDSPPDDQGVRKQFTAKLLEYELLSVERLLDRDNKRSMVVLSFNRGHDGVAAVEFDNSDFAEPKKFYNKLAAEGIYCTRKDGADFVEKFMAEFMQQLQRARAANRIIGRCGWTEDLDAFVLGTRIFKRDGTMEGIRTGAAPGEMEGYHVAGDEAEWRRAFSIALSGGVDRQCVLALAIASPLMVFTGLDGVLLNAYSPESGVGKSTLCDAALSLWGSPNVLRKDFRDTSNATFKLASVMGNMPMVVDEFTNVEGKALSDYVYTITQGREKHRLRSDATLSAGGASRWCLATIATANNSVHEKLQDYRPDSTAEAARVFEMRLRPLEIDPNRMGEIKEHLQALRNSYGFAGEPLVRAFLSRTPEFWRSAVMARIAKWDRETSEGASDRFRSALCALIEIGAALAPVIGFQMDTAAVHDELKRHWEKQVGEFNANRMTPMDFLNGYMLEHTTDMAVMGGPDGRNMLNVQQPRRFRGEIRGTTKDGKFAAQTVMLPHALLRDYVKDRNGNFKAVLEWCEASTMRVRSGQLDYLRGTTFQMQTQAIEFDYAQLMRSNAPVLQIVGETHDPSLQGTQ